MRGSYQALTGRSAWLACGTPRFSDMWEWTQSHSPPDRLNTMVARPGRSNGAWSAAYPVLVHGASTTAMVLSADASTRTASAVNRKSVVRGHTLFHCVSRQASNPGITSLWVPKASTSGWNKGRAEA